MIGLDTFSWYKFISLYKDKWKALMTDFLKNYNVFITHEVKKEFIHRFENYLHLLDLIIILPRIKSSIEYDKKKFDLADISLLEYAENPNYLIITEDHPMLAQGVTQRKNIEPPISSIIDEYTSSVRESIDLRKFRKKE